MKVNPNRTIRMLGLAMMVTGVGQIALGVLLLLKG